MWKRILTDIAEVQDVSLLVPRRLVEAVSDQIVGVFPLDDITPDDDDTWDHQTITTATGIVWPVKESNKFHGNFQNTFEKAFALLLFH